MAKHTLKIWQYQHRSIFGRFSTLCIKGSRGPHNIFWNNARWSKNSWMQTSLKCYAWGLVPYFYRSSRLKMFYKIVVLKNFAIFTGKHLCWSLFFIKLQIWKPATLSKRDSNTGVRLQHRCFPVNIEKFLRTDSFIEYTFFFYKQLVYK